MISMGSKDLFCNVCKDWFQTLSWNTFEGLPHTTSVNMVVEDV